MRTFPRGGTPEERFWARVSVGNGCWLWDANVTKKGYPNLWLEGRQHVYAHRFSYALHVGPIPDGMSVLHKCDTPSCVNPAHLFLGTQLENVRDCRDKGRLYRQTHRPTHCKQGHPFPEGRRSCAVCQRAACARYEDAHREARNAEKRARRRRVAA